MRRNFFVCSIYIKSKYLLQNEKKAVDKLLNNNRGTIN